MWDPKKKKDTSELIYKTETDPQTENTYSYQMEKRGKDKLGVWD